MPIVSVPHATLSFRCQEHGVSEESLNGCIARKTSKAAFVDSEHPDCPSWLVAPRGLGDMTADGLAAIGVTKERVSKALGRPCKCPERQAWLNRVGRILGIG
jgi:hypothetical protein